MNSANKGTQPEPTVEKEDKSLLFFNYHEYQVHSYRQLNASQENIHDQALIVTHFPNCHVAKDSVLFHTTRIVRIPRLFKSKGSQFPEFSTLLPGYEDAAIMDESGSHTFQAKGQCFGEFLGTSSVSPLGMYLTDDELSDIVTTVNCALRRAHASWSLWNVLEFLLDMFTFWIFSEIKTPSSKKSLDSLEEYIEVTNTTLCPRGVQIISPRKSAYLSLDFQIPKPLPNEQCSSSSSRNTNLSPMKKMSAT